jgi:nicotinate-nucleotide--dimethylbenzimidazole phosphoribosyltransferase
MTSAEQLASELDSIERVDQTWIKRAQARQLELTKPPGSLGRLEEVANRICAIQQSLSPALRSPRIYVFAADHGVCAEGVNPYPQEVTAQMVANFLSGGAAINSLARVCGVGLRVVDVGVACAVPGSEGLISRPISPGTRNFCCEPAMSREDAVAAIMVGIGCAHEAVDVGSNLLGIGEMGIGNTTVASVICSAITGLSAEAACGRGTGADDACLSRKISAVERALDLHRPQIKDGVDLLSRLGGFEIAAMCGVCIGAARHRCVVLADGFIATAAAAVAVLMSANVRDYLFAAHRSTEPGQAALLEYLGLRPLLDLEMRLGEGTGAALAVPLVRAAVEAFTSMATFSSAGVSEATAGNRR